MLSNNDTLASSSLHKSSTCRSLVSYLFSLISLSLCLISSILFKFSSVQGNCDGTTPLRNLGILNGAD